MFKLTTKLSHSRLFLILSIAFFSCSEDATEPTNGVDGTDGFNALVEVVNEDPGTNCETGGVKISIGQDTNENGVLDASEVVSVSFVCNGANGSNGTDGSNGTSANALVARTSAENPGANCSNGGTLVEIGTDNNNNNVLDNDEVQTSFYVCNGQDGTNGSNGGDNGLTSLIRVSPSSSCSNSGITIEIGLDANENDELDAGEISASYDICNGADGSDGTNGTNGYSTLSSVTTEDPGPNCSNGGLKISLGLDTNENGVLDNDEVVSENYVCNGTDGTNGTDGSNGTDGTDGSDGSDGTSSITRVTNEAAGANCANGGLRIEIGMDDITPDGVLQNEEVDYTYYVCNGADGSDGSDGSNGSNGSNGFNSLIRTTTEDPGANCANGGIRIDIGLDLNNNNILEPGEFLGGPLYVCDGVDGTNGTNGTNGSDGADGRNLIVVTDTDVTCPNGGIEFTFGYDDDNNGTIDEILETALICNGADGSNGSNGSNGTNGLNSIVRATPENPGTNCPGGGTLYEVGIDDNRNNVLDAGEVDTFFYVCNGADGTDGTDGTDGSNGNNSLITVTSFTGSQGGCTNGGLVIRTGVDDNGNGVLNAGEIDATSYVCNGDDGTDGTDGNSDNIFEFYYQEGFDAYTGVLDASITDKNPTETGESFSVDRGVTDSHALIVFPELERLGEAVGSQNFAIVEAILYLRGVSGRVDGQSQGNWIGVKTLLSDAPLFDEDGVTWTRANSAGDNWSLPGVTAQDQDGNANGYSDMFQLPPTGNFEFNGYIPLQLSLTEVTAWTDRDTGKDSNKGMVLIMANPGIQYELDIFSSNYTKDTNHRPLLYLKVKTGIKSRSSISEEAYRERWESLSYEEKLAPLHRKPRK